MKSALCVTSLTAVTCGRDLGSQHFCAGPRRVQNIQAKDRIFRGVCPSFRRFLSGEGAPLCRVASGLGSGFGRRFRGEPGVLAVLSPCGFLGCQRLRDQQTTRFRLAFSTQYRYVNIFSPSKTNPCFTAGHPLLATLPALPVTSKRVTHSFSPGPRVAGLPVTSSDRARNV